MCHNLYYFLLSRRDAFEPLHADSVCKKIGFTFVLVPMLFLWVFLDLFLVLSRFLSVWIYSSISSLLSDMS